MRILIAHSRYLSGDASGENRVVQDEAALLRSAGHDVRVVQREPEQTEGLGVVRTAAGAVWSRSAMRLIDQAIRTLHPDVLHVHNLLPALSPAVLRLAGRRGLPVVVTLHNYRQFCLPSTLLREGRVCEDCLGRTPWPGVLHRCYRDSLAGSAAVAASLVVHRAIRTNEVVSLFLAVSQFVKEIHVRAGVPAERIRVKSNFVASAERRTGPGEYFLFLGRLAPEKGVGVLLDAWQSIDAELVIAGDGPQGAELRRRAGPSVLFSGPLPAPEIPDLIRGARAVLVPSVWYEAQPRVILESYSAGVPVLASRIGGLAELVENDRSGLLLPPGDPVAWAAGATRLLNDEVSERMGARALALWGDRYSPEHGLTDLEASYRQAIGAAS